MGLLAGFPPVGALRAKLGVGMSDPEGCRGISVRIQPGDQDHTMNDYFIVINTLNTIKSNMRKKQKGPAMRALWRSNRD
jgi:hypothetical protein